MRKAWLGKIVVGLLLVGLLASVLTGCKSDPNKNTLVFAVSSELDGTDIQQVNTANIVQTLISPPPVVFSLDQTSLVPQVAKSVSFSEDGKTIILTFADNLKWPDGKPLTGEQYKAAVERYIEISPYSSDWADLDEIVVDGQTVNLVFNAPPASFIAVLTSQYTGIVNVEQAVAVGDEAFNRKASGIGPYVLTEWVQGSHYSFTRNSNYVDNKTFVTNKGPWSFEKATVRIIPDALTRLAELEAEKVDVAYDISVDHKDRVASNSKLTLLTSAIPGETYLRINNKKSPMNNLKFREAINYAINKAELKTALNGGGEPVYGLLSPSQLAYSQAVEDEIKAARAYDQTKAKALLAELGYADSNGDGILEKGGQPLKLVMISTNDVEAHKKAAPVVQAQLKAVGIDIELQEHGRSYVRELVAANDYDLAFQRWMWQDPDIWYFSFHSSQTNPIWTSPDIDAFLDEGRAILDMQLRAEKYGELSKAIAADMPMVPLFYSYTYTGVRKAITGLYVAIDGSIYFNDAKK